MLLGSICRRKSNTDDGQHHDGLVDPSLSAPVSDISYHFGRRSQGTLSLRSYSDPPPLSKFAEYDYFDFQLNDVRPLPLLQH